MWSSSTTLTKTPNQRTLTYCFDLITGYCRGLPDILVRALNLVVLVEQKAFNVCFFMICVKTVELRNPALTKNWSFETAVEYCRQ
jgi:hypothetical protein